MSKEIVNGIIGIALIIGMFKVFSNTMSATPDTRPTTSAPTAGESFRPLGVEDLYKFVGINHISRDRFLSSTNEVERGSIRRMRGEALCREMNSRFFEGWFGVVSDVSTSSNGQNLDRVIIEISDYVTLSDNSVYRPGSSMHSTFLTDVTVGTSVLFSGELKYHDRGSVSDCFQERSVFLRGGMTNPRYTMVISSISSLE